MRRLALLLALFLLFTSGAAAQEVVRPGPKKAEVAEAAAAAWTEAVPFVQEAQRAFAEKEWDLSIEKYAAHLAALGDDPVLGGWRDQAHYNIACAHARAGRPAKAAAEFAASVKHGLRPIVGLGPDGAWYEAPGLILEHVLADADLATIRAEPAYVEALKPYLAAGEPVLEFTRPETSSLVPAVIVLAAEGEDVERALVAWRVAGRERPIALVAVAGPVREKPTDRRWILGDGDERWAVAKIKETLDLVVKDIHVDPKRIFLVGIGARPGEAAWAAALPDSERLAGLAAPGARFHAEWHADAIEKAPATWRAALFATDAVASKLLTTRGVTPVVLEPAAEESALAAAILAALLDKP